MSLPFELQGDEGDEERVKMNLIYVASQQGTLKRTETDKEIRFQGMITIPAEKLKLIKNRKGRKKQK